MADSSPVLDPDLFVAWLADVKHGSLDRLRSDLCWAADVARSEADRWLTLVDRLGHIELNWRDGTWSAQPLRVTPLPGPIKVSLVLGARPHPDLTKGLDGFVTARLTAVASGLPLPSTIWFEGNEEDAAALLSAEPIPCEAARVANSLRRLRSGRPTPGPAKYTELRPFDARVGRFQLSRHLPSPGDGLYRYDLHGKIPQYLLRRHGDWYEVDRDEGIHLSLPPAAFPLEWCPEFPRHRGGPALGCLTVSEAAPLPRVHASAAVLCTGLPPLKSGQRAIYDGVPRWMAEKISSSLGRTLEAL